MSRLSAALFVAFALVASPSYAQTSSTRADLQSQTTATIFPNTVGAVTPGSLKALLANIIASEATLLDLNSLPLGNLQNQAGHSLVANPGSGVNALGAYGYDPSLYFYGSPPLLGVNAAGFPMSASLLAAFGNGTTGFGLITPGGGGAPYWGAVSGGSGVGLTKTEPLTVSGSNTISTHLSQTPSGGTLELRVNGKVEPGTGSTPSFTVSAGVVSWSAANAGYSIGVSDEVFAYYTY
jgi:hypothetical protein